MIKWILFVLTMLFLGGLYLWAVENCRIVCGVLWFFGPFVALLFSAWIERGANDFY